MERKKRLSELAPAASIDPWITGLQYDSRQVKAGDLFFAVPGFLDTGVKYLASAFAKGAVAAIVPKEVQLDPSLAAKCVPVDDLRLAMADMAGKFYGYPARKMKLIGVTGTKGKTSTSYLLESIFKAAGKTTALLGTVECKHPGRSYPSHHTTREAIDLQSFLAEAAEFGVDTVVMEVSSHALSLHRVAGFEFDGVAFTNLSADHMDFYKTMEPYYQAKRLLFLPPYRKAGAPAVSNADDEYGRRILAECPGTNASFGRQAGDYQIQETKLSEKGVFLRLNAGTHGKIDLQSQLQGEFNIFNIAAASTLALQMGCKPEAVRAGVENLVGVPGRLERVPTTMPFSVFVDFAHTGVALESVVKCLRPVCRNRLIVLFGAGGDKDPARRTTQGQVAARLADFTFITSDNPRSEDPLKIIAAIEKAYVEAGGKNFRVEPDRRLAIRAAIEMAQAGDILCFAGKGHETGQIVGDVVIPFDDRIEAGLVLREREKAH